MWPSARPRDVGILAMSVYTPGMQVPQTALEVHDNCVGKYTVGLGQLNMAFCSDREDVVSLALTAVTRLLEATAVDPRTIGRLEVGTESAVDRSKSIKSHLMQLLQACGNHDVEGVDCMHACYGGTAALLSACAWVESSAWDGRLAIVVASDVALYAPGCAAVATGGAGAVALLVGPDAPLALDPMWRTTHADHTQEFCKPPGAAPYPVMDGPHTVQQFFRAAECCYSALVRRVSLGRSGSQISLPAAAPRDAAAAPAGSDSSPSQGPPPSASTACDKAAATDSAAALSALAAQAATWGLAVGRAVAASVAADHPGRVPPARPSCGAVGLLQEVDHFLSHAPYHRIVVKAFARLVNQDALRALRVLAQHGGDDNEASASGAAAPASGTGCTSGAQQHAPAAVTVGGLSTPPASVNVAAAASAAAAGAAAVSPSQPAPPPLAGCAAGRATEAELPSGATSRPAASAAAAGAAAVSPPQPVPPSLADGGSGGTGEAPPPACVKEVEPSPVLTQATRVAVAAHAAGLWTCLDPATHPPPRMDAGLERHLLEVAAPQWEAKGAPGCWAQRRVGNTYTACLFFGLAGLVELQGAALAGKRVLLFAFGSGTMSSMFSLVGRTPLAGSRFTLEAMGQQLGLSEMLAARRECAAEDLTTAAERHRAGHSTAPWEPVAAAEDVAPGAYMCEGVDARYRRRYSRRPAAAAAASQPTATYAS